MHVSFHYSLPQADEEIDIDDVTSCDEEKTLSRWYTSLLELYDWLRIQIDERRNAGIDDARWYDATSGKCAYLRIGMKRVEARMIFLGFTPPYPLGDKRTREIRALHESLRRLRALCKANGLDPDAKAAE